MTSAEPARIESAALIPFEITVKFGFKVAPQLFARDHQRNFVRIAHLDADEPPGARALLAGNARFIDQHDFHAGLGHVIGAGATLNAGTDDDHIGARRAGHSAGPRRSPEGQHRDGSECRAWRRILSIAGKPMAVM